MIYQIILIFIIVFIYDQIKTLFFDKETFQTTITGYQADIEAIRNLSSIATQLTTNNKLTMPGSLTITNKLATNNLDPNNMPDGWGGGIRTYDLYSSATIACGPDGKEIKSYLNSSGDGYFARNVTINGNLKVNGGINTVNGLATTAYGSGWSSIFYKLPTNFSGFFQVFVQGYDNKYLFATGFWIPNATMALAPKQDTNVVNNWTLKVDWENNGGTMGNPVIYLKSSSGGDRIWYSVITYPTPNHEGK